MLPPINLLNTDPVESGSDIPAGTGFYRDPAGFRISLGEALGSQATDAQQQLPIEVGELLPPLGNTLPVETLPPLTGQDSPGQIGPIAALDDEGMLGDIFGADESIAQTGADESLLLEGPLPNPQSVVAVAGPVEYGFSTPRDPLEYTLRLPGDPLSAAQMRDAMQRPVTARAAPAIDVQGAGPANDRAANQQTDLASRPAVAEQMMSLAAKDTLSFAGNAASVSFKQFAEKFDAMQRSVAAATSQPGLTATDTISPLQGAGQASRIAPPPVLQASIDIPVLDDGWAEALHERVTWMAGKSIQRAEIRLNPANMGPIRVEVSVSDDAATVTFSAQHAVTRDAIELAMPRLREMLSENGMSLANTSVSDTDVQHGEHASENETLPGHSDDAGNADDTEVTMTPPMAARSLSGLVDTFV